MIMAPRIDASIRRAEMIMLNLCVNSGLRLFIWCMLESKRFHEMSTGESNNRNQQRHNS